MTDLYKSLVEKGEFYAAELVINTDRTPLYRYSCATAAFFKNAELIPYDGGQLYPCGPCMANYHKNHHISIRPEFSYSFWADMNGLRQKSPEAADLLSAEFSQVAPINTPHTVGGAGYTHSFINYRRILADGLDGYRARVEKLPDCDFRDAMLALLDGIEVYRQRCVALLKESSAPKRLIKALEYVPNKTPRDIYEALVAWNFMYYVDGCDDLGGLDRGLLPYWKGEDIRELLTEIYRHVDQNDGWSSPLGPEYNGLTVQCIDAAQNSRRPNIQLLVTDDMPEEIWQAAYRSIGTSCGQPALYNWREYKAQINKRIPEVSEEDLKFIAFGGCTETMIEGMSNVGSDDAGINTALIFDGYLRGELKNAATFEEFLEGYVSETKKVIASVCENVEEYRKTRAMFRPQPIRTLLIDDCIDRMKEFNNGGARYNWSVINVAGLINVIDSMQAIKALVYEDKKIHRRGISRKARQPRSGIFSRLCPSAKARQ